MASHKSFTKAASMMLVAVLLSRILGFVRDMLIARQFGQGGPASAYTSAFNLPDLLYFFLSSGALSSAFIPVFTERFRTGREKEAWQIFSIIACLMGLVLTAAIIVCWVYAKPLVSVLAVPGFVDKYPKLVDITVFLTRIILPCQLFFFIGGLMMGTLESRQKFSARASGPVIYNVGIIFGAIVLSHWFHIAGLAWGALIGAFAGNVLYTFYCMKKEGYEFYPSLNIRHPGVVRVGQLALPVILGLSLPQIDIIVNKYFASFVSDSAPAALNYANRLMQVPLGIFAQAAGTAILPMLAAYAAKHAYDDMRSGLGYGLRAILVENIPSTLFMVVMADPIIRTVYMSGEFRPSDVPVTAVALMFYSAGIFAWAGQAIVARGFFALQDTITPVVIGTVSTAIFVPVNYFLMKMMGIAGIALSTTIAATLHFVLLTLFLRKRLHGLEGAKTMKTAGRIFVASLAMAVLCIGIRIEMSRLVGSWQFQDGDIVKPSSLAYKLQNVNNPLSSYLYSHLSGQTRQIIADSDLSNEKCKFMDKYQSEGWDNIAIGQAFLTDLNRVMTSSSIYDADRFANVKLSNEAKSLLKMNPHGEELVHLNRLLLSAVYPEQIKKINSKKTWLLDTKDVGDSHSLAVELVDSKNPVSRYLYDKLSPQTKQLITPATVPQALADDINRVLQGPSVYNPKLFAKVKLPEDAQKLLRSNPRGSEVVHLNRLLLAAAFPSQISEGGVKGQWLLTAGDIEDERKFALLLSDDKKPFSVYLLKRLSSKTHQLLAPAMMPLMMMRDLNKVIRNGELYSAGRFAGVQLPIKTLTLAQHNPTGKQLSKLNRLLLQAAYSGEVEKRPFGRVESKLGSALTVLIAMILGGIVYFTLLRLLRVEEADFLWNSIKRKFSKKPAQTPEAVAK